MSIYIFIITIVTIAPIVWFTTKYLNKNKGSTVAIIKRVPIQDYVTTDGGAFLAPSDFRKMSYDKSTKVPISKLKELRFRPTRMVCTNNSSYINYNNSHSWKKYFTFLIRSIEVNSSISQFRFDDKIAIAYEINGLFVRYFNIYDITINVESTDVITSEDVVQDLEREFATIYYKID
jgi:hypothetical protein